MSRDLDEDLEICKSVKPGPWTTYKEPNHFIGGYVAHVQMVPGDTRNSIAAPFEVAEFIAQAREGWPHAIKRAKEAEEEVEQLKHEMRMLQDELNQRRRQAWPR